MPSNSNIDRNVSGSWCKVAPSLLRTFSPPLTQSRGRRSSTKDRAATTPLRRAKRMVDPSRPSAPRTSPDRRDSVTAPLLPYAATTPLRGRPRLRILLRRGRVSGCSVTRRCALRRPVFLEAKHVRYDRPIIAVECTERLAFFRFSDELNAERRPRLDMCNWVLRPVRQDGLNTAR
jgi:hypothetical protein